MKHIVCYSGGATSAKVAINVVKKFGKENVVLLNHDINKNVEDKDIKRFKKEVADYLGLPITYRNWQGKNSDEIKDHFEICEDLGGFQFGISQVMCTYHLKTLPFQKYLAEEIPAVPGEVRDDTNIYYGFDKTESNRITRRAGILGCMGYKSDYPRAMWKDFDDNCLVDAGINPPMQYGKFKHANCMGCIKAGAQHWYVVFCERPDIWERAKLSEDRIGHSILKGSKGEQLFLEDLEEKFKIMKCLGVEASEHIPSGKFWSNAKRLIQNRFNLQLFSMNNKPCECTF